MCNFHAAVATAAATDPATGKIHAGHKAVIRVALSRYWASSYVDGAENVDGYNFYPLATTAQQAAFERSGLKRPIIDVQKEEQAAIDFLRKRIQDLSQSLDLSPEGLRLPLPTAREAFMDLAIEKIYEGDPKAGLTIVQDVGRDDLRPLHRAVLALHADARTSQLLERLVQGKICDLYTQAPQRVNKSLVDAYEALPDRIKVVSSSLAKYGGNIVLGGFSGIVGHGIHYASVLGAGLAAGTASSANIALSGAFLAVSYGGWHQAFGGQYRAVREKINAFAIQTALTLGVAIGAQQFMDHDHMAGERAVWFASLPPEMRESLTEGSKATYTSLPGDLRLRLDEKAAEEGIPPEVYLLTCSGDDPVSQEINAYLQAKNGGIPALSDALRTVTGP